MGAPVHRGVRRFDPPAGPDSRTGAAVTVTVAHVILSLGPSSDDPAGGAGSTRKSRNYPAEWPALPWSSASHGGPRAKRPSSEPGQNLNCTEIIMSHRVQVSKMHTIRVIT
jgi:hypothetical protein